MPESIPLRKAPNSRLGDLLFDADLDRNGPSSPSRDSTRASSPSTEPPHPARNHKGTHVHFAEPASPDDDLSFDDWDESAPSHTMPSDLRPDVDRERDGRSLSPLLGSHKRDDEGTESGTLSRSTHTFHERDPASQAHLETRKRYTYAAIFLALSLVSFTVQTETAVYIQHELKWEKPFCML
jgi:hypothetical protein